MSNVEDRYLLRLLVQLSIVGMSQVQGKGHTLY